MPVRDVTIRGTAHEAVGDETVELWLKRGAGDWALEQSVAIDTSNPPFQDFLVLGLESGLNHVAQIRVFRDGRYRAGYLGGDPDAWPIQSRLEFVPGAEAAPAPEIVSGEFERTSGVAHEIRITVTPNPLALDLDIDLLADGVVVDTIAGPHVGDVVLTHANPAIATAIFYTARHRQFTLNGIETDPFRQWVGPPAPTDFVQVAEISDYYAYHVEWATPGGMSIRIRDDWPIAGFINRALEGSGTTHRDQTVEKESEMDEGSDEQVTFCQVEVRHELSAFAVTDVSEWVGDTVSITDHLDETAH